MSTTRAGPLADVGTLAFDVLGTVVDEAGSVAAETARPGRLSRLCRAGKRRHA